MHLKQIELEIEKRLSPKRFNHSLNVCEKALELGKLYGLNEERVQKAALLHDIAKDIDLLRALDLALQLDVTITKEEEENPALIHSKLGAAITKKELGVNELDILHAIEFHTTGKPGMGMLETVIYVADYLDPEKELENHQLINRTAQQNINKAALLVCIEKLKFSMETFKHIHQRGLDFYNFLVEKKAKKS